MSSRFTVFLAGIIFLILPAVNASAFQCADVTEIPTAECEALVDLFNSTDGANWQDKTGWLADNTPCDWFGVTCKNDRIDAINLNSNGLVGNLPEAIGNFTSATYLNLSGNKLSGAIPNSVGQLLELQGLWLGDNQLASLPDSIGDCSKLTHLDLRKNQISSLPSRIGDLTGLTYLTLHTNQLTASSIPAGFANLSLLTTLSFQSNKLTSLPAPVSEMTNLKSLDLSGNKPMDSLEGIGNLTGLETLHLYLTDLTELPEEFASLTNLKELRLNNNFLTHFPSAITELTSLETLLLTYNPQMSGELPLSLVNLTQMKEFKFDGTELCVPDNAGLQAWLAGIITVVSSDKECAAPSNMSDIEKSVRVMRMLTGHEGSCSDLDVDGDGKVESVDAVLSLQQAANVSDTTCGDNWTVIGEIPEYSFSSEPLIDENTAFTMNVDPFDQLMLTAVTTNGWTIEYFAEKNEMGAPIFLTKIHTKKDETGEYLEVTLDGESRPIFIEQQEGKSILLNWNNCTMYGENEWLGIEELPDFSSIPSPVLDDHAEFIKNIEPESPLWLTVTTRDGWTLKYFGTKDTNGSLIAITFLHAINNTSGDVVMAEIDKYGQPSRISKQDGEIVRLNWQQHIVSIESGILNIPDSSIPYAYLRSENAAISTNDCRAGARIAQQSCGFIRKMPGRLKILAAAFFFNCHYLTASISTICQADESSPPVLICKHVADFVDAIGAVATFVPGLQAIGLGISIGAMITSEFLCEPLFGNSSGDPHLYTFDRSKYDFQAAGEFVLLESKQDPSEMTIQIRQGPWPGSKRIAGNTATAMSVGGDRVEFNVENTPPLAINSVPTTMVDKEIIHLENGNKIYAESQRRYWVIWKDNSMAKVKTYNNHLDISVSLPKNRMGRIGGLLGNGDGDNTNDLQTRVGGQLTTSGGSVGKRLLYHDFGNSWRVSQSESLFSYDTDEDTSTYTDLNFPYELVKASDLSEAVRANAEQICKDAGIIDPILLEDCILDVGMTGDSTFADNMTDLTPPEQSITVTDGWKIYGHAQQVEGENIVRITPDLTWRNGMALREGALNLDGDFEKTFTIYVGNSNLGGDGMVFLMLPEIPPKDISLNGGEGLGFNSACNGKPCLGVEIDTYHNSFDPAGDHIALIQNGSVNHNNTDNQALPLVSLKDDSGATLNIEDDAEHALTIEWKKDTQTLSVTLDGNQIISYDGIDIKTLLGTSLATYGFVGTTGTATSKHYFYPVTSF